MRIPKTPGLLALSLAAMIFSFLAPITLAVEHLSPDEAGLTPDESQLIGTWTGESICQVRDSPCHDEHVVYHITRGKKPGTVAITADKIVDGKAMTMGTIEYTYDSATGTLLNETDGRIWRFTVQGKKMEGTLTLADKTVYRRVSLKKDE